MADINYTIIIPHKNTPYLLQRCLRSIPRREDIQVIVVDDSSDIDIVDFLKSTNADGRYVVYQTNEGKGAGYARNVGLGYARGKWLLFADADDYFVENFINRLDDYINSPYDLIYFGVNGIDADTQMINRRGLKYNALMENVLQSKDIEPYLYRGYVPWGKMIKTSLVKENSITFDQTFVANDIMFSIKVAYNSKCTHFDRAKIYTLESRRGSLVTKKSKQALIDRLSVYIRLNVFLCEIDKTKYQINLMPTLFRMFIKGGIVFLINGLRIVNKANEISLIKELGLFIISVPKRYLIKLKQMLSNKYKIL